MTDEERVRHPVTSPATGIRLSTIIMLWQMFNINCNCLIHDYLADALWEDVAVHDIVT